MRSIMTDYVGPIDSVTIENDTAYVIGSVMRQTFAGYDGAARAHDAVTDGA